MQELEGMDMTEEETEVTQDEIFENMNNLQETNQQHNWQSKLISNSTGAYKKSTTNGELIIQKCTLI